ncbi:MAG: hypothetical protein HGJ94_18275 [Desulfosarcina sp.]|nr:hypothetical protein [Desulfosarcina sp.]
MKIYNQVVIDINTGKVIDEDWFEYAGPVAECKGGSSTTTTVDPVFNAGMLELSKEQQSWGRDLFNQFKYGVDYDPTEEVTGYYDESGKFVEGQSSLIKNPDYKPPVTQRYATKQGEGTDLSHGRQSFTRPAQGEEYIKDPNREYITKTRGELNGLDPNITSEMEYLQQLIQANASLLPEQTALQRLQMSETTKAIKEQAPVRSAYFREALEGVDPNQRMDEAQADASQAASSSERTALRTAARTGVSAADVNTSELATNRTKILGQARTSARRTAEEDNFNRLRTAMATGF